MNNPEENAPAPDANAPEANPPAPAGDHERRIPMGRYGIYREDEISSELKELLESRRLFRARNFNRRRNSTRPTENGTCNTLFDLASLMSKMTFSEDRYLYRLWALPKAKQCHKEVSNRKSTKFNNWRNNWERGNVTEEHNTSTKKWFLGEQFSCQTEEKKIENVQKAPYFEYTKYVVKIPESQEPQNTQEDDKKSPKKSGLNKSERGDKSKDDSKSQGQSDTDCEENVCYSDYIGNTIKKLMASPDSHFKSTSNRSKSHPNSPGHKYKSDPSSPGHLSKSYPSSPGHLSKLHPGSFGKKSKPSSCINPQLNPDADETKLRTIYDGADAQRTMYSGVAELQSRMNKSKLRVTTLECSPPLSSTNKPKAKTQTDGAESSTEPQAASLDPQAASLDPQAASLDPQAASVEPRAASVEPRAASLEPQAASLEPQAASLEPQAASLEPRAASLEPRAASLEPRAASLEPRAASLEPRAASLEPRAASLEPQGGTGAVPKSRRKSNTSRPRKTVVKELKDQPCPDSPSSRTRSRTKNKESPTKKQYDGSPTKKMKK